MYPILHLGTFSLYTFGICVGLGVLASYRVGVIFCARAGLNISVLRLFLIFIPGGLLAAHLDGTALATPGGFAALLKHPVDRLALGGYTYFGGLIGALVCGCLVILFSGWPLLPILDGVFCAGLGYAIGRIGCFLAGDGDYGPPTSVPWGVRFPDGMVPTNMRVHPTMLYIAAWEFALFALLWWAAGHHRWTGRRPGTLFAIYLIGTGFGRFLIEFVSRNPPSAFGLTEAQLMSGACVGAGTILLCVRRPHSANCPHQRLPLLANPAGPSMSSVH